MSTAERPTQPDFWDASQDQLMNGYGGSTLWESDGDGVRWRLRALDEIPGEIEYFLEEYYPTSPDTWHYAGKLSGSIARALIENAGLRMQLRRAEAGILAHVQLSGKTVVETERRITEALSAVEAVESDLMKRTEWEMADILRYATKRVRAARAATGVTDG